MKTKSRVIQLPGEIVRVDRERRTVELYAYVNAIVPTQKWDLTRAAMEAATPDYMKWANVREMHDPKKAAGLTRVCAWDDKGCKLEVEIVDDDAWKKVDTGVYKGASVGIIPTVVKDNQIRGCIWHETSLVDRPADADALILGRSETALDAEEEYEVEVEWTRSEDPPAVDPPAPPAPQDSPTVAFFVQRMEGQATEITRLTAENADLKRQLGEADVTQVRTLKAEVERLKALPMRFQPVRFTDPLTGMERRFSNMKETPKQKEAEGEAAVHQARMEEIQRIAQDPEKRNSMTEVERQALANEYGHVKLKYIRAVATAATANALGTL